MPNVGLILPDILRLIQLIAAGAGAEEIVFAVISDLSQIVTPEEQAKLLDLIEREAGHLVSTVLKGWFRRGPVPATSTDEIRAEASLLHEAMKRSPLLRPAHTQPTDTDEARGLR